MLALDKSHYVLLNKLWIYCVTFQIDTTKSACYIQALVVYRKEVKYK